MARSAALLVVVVMAVCSLVIEPAAALSLRGKANAEEANNPAPATDDASRRHLRPSASSGANRLGTGNEGYTVTPQNPTSGVSVMSTESNTTTGSTSSATSTSTSSKSTNSETVSTTISVRRRMPCPFCTTAEPRFFPKDICDIDDDWWQCKRGHLRPCVGGCRKCFDYYSGNVNHNAVFTRGFYKDMRCCDGVPMLSRKCPCKKDRERIRQEQDKVTQYCRV